MELSESGKKKLFGIILELSAIFAISKTNSNNTETNTTKKALARAIDECWGVKIRKSTFFIDFNQE